MSSQYEPRLRLVEWQSERQELDDFHRAMAMDEAHRISWETGFIEGALLMIAIFVVVLGLLWWLA